KPKRSPARSTSKRKGSRKSKKPRIWPKIFWRLFFVGFLVGAGWVAWIDYQLREDFGALQWALPARIYARPVELYAGAHLGVEELADYLRRLGYRQASQVDGPGEFQVTDSRLRLSTRGFEFWDGTEPPV